MSQVRLVVREAGRDWSGTVHGSCADRAIAALSADPATLEELENAVARFAKPVDHQRFFTSLSAGLCDEPYDAGLVVVDLVARLVVVDSTYSAPGLQGDVAYHDGRSATDVWLPYHLADDWLFVYDRHAWPAAADERRQRAVSPDLDHRAVLYGPPLLEFVARHAFAAFARREAIAALARAKWAESARRRLARDAGVSVDEVDVGQLTEEAVTPQPWPGQERYASPFYDALKEIHVDWLLTPRDDLGGACPRDVALARRDHLERDLEDRCLQWTRLNACPPGLDACSFAFRFGPFGTHEWVMYYELVRELLWSAWERLVELDTSPRAADRPQALAVGDFLTAEVPRLQHVARAWLDAPHPEFPPRTPRSIIDRERARLPEGTSGEEAMIDPDCPCCQMLGEMSGPGFWHFDGSGMDDEFAFSLYHDTRQQWEAERRDWEERDKRFAAEWNERKRLGMSDDPDGDSSSVWSSSFSVGDQADVPLGARVFGIGCHLAELIADMRGAADRASTPRDVQQFIDQLNRDFGNFRELLQTTEHSLAETLIDPLRERFAETLSDVAAFRPDLSRKCESLTAALADLCKEPRWPDEDCDPELPF